MPEKIQRNPRGLIELLSLSGGNAPTLLADLVSPTLELLQFYGLQQRTVLTAANAALTEGTVFSITLPAFWCVLFGAELQIVKTATVTALSGSIGISRGSGAPSLTVAAEALGPFGATETGTARLPWWAPYPLLCPPLTVILGRADIIGTDANVNASLSAEVGVLG